jgi:diacylglycerol O-acyltransferase / wax synthase
MAQRHLDRLSAVDVSFLAQEGPNTHMHIGGVCVFEGPPPDYEDLCRHIESRLHLVPRYRHKIAEPRFEAGRPLWIDDPSFNIGYHLRHTALPAPGGDEELMALTARIFSQRLDRSKPLWELWLVEQVEGDRFALISKVHHSLIDGVAGADLMTVLFDVDAEPREVEPEPWMPHREPSGAELVAAGAGGLVRTAAELAAGAASLATHPGEVARAAREALGGVGEIVALTASPPPPTPFNAPPGPHRRMADLKADLAQFKAIKDALRGTVNDVVLAVVGGALRQWMLDRGEPVDGVTLRVCVPVSVRTDAQKGALGNELTQMIAPLPLGISDPAERLAVVREAMQGVKSSRQAVGAKTIANIQGFAPPTILAQASRMNFSGRFYNLLVTNIPGPQFPLYVLGRRLEAMVPVPFLAGDRGLAIAIMSYDGSLNFGLLADYDTMPDLEHLADRLHDAIAELAAAAGVEDRRNGRAKTPAGRQARAKAKGAAKPKGSGAR